MDGHLRTGRHFHLHGRQPIERTAVEAGRRQRHVEHGRQIQTLQMRPARHPQRHVPNPILQMRGERLVGHVRPIVQDAMKKADARLQLLEAWRPARQVGDALLANARK